MKKFDLINVSDQQRNANKEWKSKEPKPDIAICSEGCRWEGSVKECVREEEGDYENGYYMVDVCPTCGECIGDYTMSDERALEWDNWNKRKGEENENS